MKVLLDIQDARSEFFMEIIRSLKFVRILGEINDPGKSRAAENLFEAFQDVNAYERGEKKLKKAKDLLNEL
jgi:hypothetical protein